jgi:hypothetical protein
MLLSFCVEYTRDLFVIKFVFHGSRFRVNVPYTWKLEKGIFEHAGGPKKNLLQFYNMGT